MIETANVDLRHAVKADVFFRGARSLPMRGVAVASDERPRDRCGRVRSPATFSSYRKGLKPPNAGLTFPATPPTPEQVLHMLAVCPDNPSGRRLRALIVVLWRAGLRIHEALNLVEADLDRDALTVTVNRGKGGKYRVAGMDERAWELLQPWLDERRERLPHGPVFCIVRGATAGQHWSTSGARTAVRDLGRKAGVPRRVAPHQLRHALAIEWHREGAPVIYISLQFGHSNVGTTNTYLAGIDNHEVVQAIAKREWPVPALPAGAIA